MAHHELKTWPHLFAAMSDGKKPFDLRNNRGRNFRVGDTILLREWVPNEEHYTGQSLTKYVTYVLNPRPDQDPDCGLVPGYVALGLADTPNDSSIEEGTP
jgi:hypothetical protein